MLKKILAFVVMLYATLSFAAVDVNKATAAELDGIKGIGPSISSKIVDERKKGNFKDWADFIERVKGIGDGNAAKFSAEGLTVGGAAFKGAATAPAAPAAKKDDKPAVAAKAEEKKVEAKPAAAPAAKEDKKDPKAEAKAKKEADKKAADEEKAKKADEAKAKKEEAKKAKDAKPAAKDDKAEAAKSAASAAKK